MLELLLDRERVQLFTVKPPQREAGVSDSEQPSHEKVDQHLKIRVPVTRRAARARRGVSEEAVGAARNRASALPGALQFLPASADPAGHLLGLDHRPVCAAKGPGDTPSRRRIFVSRPASRSQEDGSARRILAALMRRAYRRPVTDADLQGPLDALPEGARRGRLRSGHRDGAVGRAGEPGVPVPRRTGSGRHPAEHGLSRQRSGAGVAALVLPVEQHSGR